MTEEEKKAIEEIKKFKFTESEKTAEENGLEHAEFARFLTIYHRKQLNILLNLIEKLQKENEEKDKKILGRKFYEVDLNELLKENYIPKDKVRELLKKSACEEKYDFRCAYEKLLEDFEELLEED